jgi:hypothetical protein
MPARPVFRETPCQGKQVGGERQQTIGKIRPLPISVSSPTISVWGLVSFVL